MRRRVRNAWNQPAVAKCGSNGAARESSATRLGAHASYCATAMCDKICCQSLEDRDELATWMIQSDDSELPPSLCAAQLPLPAFAGEELPPPRVPTVRGPLDVSNFDDYEMDDKYLKGGPYRGSPTDWDYSF